MYYNTKHDASLNSTSRFNPGLLAISLIIVFALQSCDRNELLPYVKGKHNVEKVEAYASGTFPENFKIDEVQIVSRSHGGYHAIARGSGFIPGGEYEGQRFVVNIEGEYSGTGMYTLTSGAASVRIRRENFNSVESVDLMSFCCGEGHLFDFGTHWEFTVYGQVEHTPGTPHNHLFAGLGSTLGTMNFNIADQTGTITEPEPGGPPPHDPGIGLIIDIPAHPVRVEVP